ncbi:MAG: triose-phosphate isomerase [Bacteroidota bacterium]
MKLRTSLVLGNWKMNTLPEEGRLLARQIVPTIMDGLHRTVEWGLAAPMTHLAGMVHEIKGHALLGAQDCSAHDRGAYTGEVSAAMLKAIGCHFSLVGHSERRLYHGELSEQGGLKIRRLQEQGLMAVYCVGESLEQRQSGAYAAVIEAQLQEALGGGGLSLDPSALVLAYEPVWAIGTGLTASPEQANEVHALIRGWIYRNLGPEAAASLRILYGGSVNATNADELMAGEDVDGALVGGASLQIRAFADIVLSAP